MQKKFLMTQKETAFRRSHDVQKLVHSKIKFMVARNRKIVTNLVHDIHDPFAVRKCAEHRPLNGIAIVHKRHTVSP